MTKDTFNKRPLTYQEQINLLKKRGLLVKNEDKALHLLSYLGYYRLSGYWHSLLKEPKSAHHFKKSSTFEQAFEMYCFDRELRSLIANQIEKIEIAIRAIITHECSMKLGTFWLSDPNNFTSNINKRTGEKRYHEAINKIKQEFNRSKEPFVLEYKNKYAESLPPSWISFEVCSFGSLSIVYSLLKSSNLKRTISNKFELSDTVFKTWLHSLVYIRNICAHHSRFWNKRLKIQPKSPKKPKQAWIQELHNKDTRTDIEVDIKDRSYFTLSMILYLLKIINPKNTFKEKLEQLFLKYPSIDRKAMGYTQNWESEPLWQ